MLTTGLIIVWQNDDIVARLENPHVGGPVPYAPMAAGVARRRDVPAAQQINLALAFNNED
jgi:hypothetical protein